MTARMSTLRIGTQLRSDKGTIYRVDGQIGQGGFGTTYSGHRVSARGRTSGRVCIKVCRDQHDWHGEAFFGKLVKDFWRVVRLLDAFVSSTGAGAEQKRRHILIMEFMDEGTVWDAIEAGSKPWSEAHVRAEIRWLLNDLGKLHIAGVTHRDLKPDNIFLRGGELALGDFGITRMTLKPGQGSASVFAPDFAPNNVLHTLKWGCADDVYQVGLLAATLVSGELWWTGSVSARSIARLPASNAFKSWIWHATGAQSKRYWDAYDAMDALQSLRSIRLKPGRTPRSLAGQHVVFSGRLDGLTHLAAAALARGAGAVVNSVVQDSTSVIVLQTTVGGVGDAEGLMLFAVRERLRLGQRIRILNQRQFERLAAR